MHRFGKVTAAGRLPGEAPRDGDQQAGSHSLGQSIASIRDTMNRTTGCPADVDFPSPFHNV